MVARLGEAVVKVRRAATVICVRRCTAGVPTQQTLTWAEAMGGCPWPPALGSDPDGHARVELVFGGPGKSVLLESPWEVLMGQNEVVNWMRSTPDRRATMRYAGEWKFAGGVVDPGEEPEAAARRELQEEFALHLPPDSVQLRLMSIRQTRPIRQVSNIMYNYLAVAEENPWLQQLDVVTVNARLEAKRQQHAKLIDSGCFWSLSKADKEQVSPEVHEVCWLSLRTAVLNAFSSMSPCYVPVNDFQRLEYARAGLDCRDTMFLTMATLLDVSTFPSLRSICRHAKSLDVAAELGRAQWLFDGQSASSADASFHTRLQSNNGRSPAARAAMLVERRRQDDLEKARELATMGMRSTAEPSGTAEKLQSKL
mmetsp:Transcript_70287/g.139294  ORF Transcript_70287/g.139294 Transcript_70287/m.139294 type:complete len:368 (+) Transcript_70287:134-1237(+)